jgi:hypothetical protein
MCARHPLHGLGVLGGRNGSSARGTSPLATPHQDLGCRRTPLPGRRRRASLHRGTIGYRKMIVCRWMTNGWLRLKGENTASCDGMVAVDPRADGPMPFDRN